MGNINMEDVNISKGYCVVCHKIKKNVFTSICSDCSKVLGKRLNKECRELLASKMREEKKNG